MTVKSGSATGDGGYGEIRTQLDVAKLEDYLQKNIEGVKLPLDVKQFKFGQSNPTYFVTDSAGTRWVLRKKPPGKLVSKTAHAVEREYKVLKAIADANAGVPAPKVYALCTDETVLGTPFYLMEFLDGRIFTDVNLPEIEDKEERRKLWLSVVRTLAKLHKLDPVKIGLKDYGSMKDFYPRQIKSLSKVSQAQSEVKDKESGDEVGEIHDIKSLMKWYADNCPKGETTIVHGDFKMDNVVFHKTKPEVIGVLDWELSTLGHPFSDLANLLQPFYVPSEVSAPGAMSGLRGVSDADLRIPNAETLMKLYCSEVGRQYPLPGWPAAVSFAFFRLSVIMQGIAARSAVGQASSAQAKRYASMFVPVGLLAIDTIREMTGEEMPYVDDDEEDSKAKL